MAPDLAGKTALCIGSTSGIGRAIAFKLASLKANVAVVGRNPMLGAEMIQELQRINPAGKFEFIKCDCSLMHQISRAAEEFSSKFDKVCNF